MATEESPGSEPGQDAAAGGSAATPPTSGDPGINQGATGARPLGESPASVPAKDSDAFDERPEAFVGAAFIGGFALAMILRRVAR
jgi:hypothetical protein